MLSGRQKGMELNDTSRQILCYSGHAVRRMMERGISERQATETVLHGKPMERGRDTTVWGWGRIRIVLSDGGMVISAWREKKFNPKRTYQKMKSRQGKLFRGR